MPKPLIALISEQQRKPMLKAFVRHALLNLVKKYEREETGKYFTRLYKDNDTSPLLDGTTGWYQRPLQLLQKGAPELFARADALAVDLGTGTGTACAWLYDHGWQGGTIGIDLVSSLSHQHAHRWPRHSFMAGDLNENALAGVGKPVDLFMALNALTYVVQPEKLLQAMSDQAAPNAHLMVIDPHPSLYWRPEARAYIRKSHILKDLFEKTGWHVVLEARTAFFKWAGYPILPLAQAYLCRKN